MSDWKCEKRGCKEKNPETLTRFNGYGNNKNKKDNKWYCETCFTKSESEGAVEVIKEAVSE